MNWTTPKKLSLWRRIVPMRARITYGDWSWEKFISFWPQRFFFAIDPKGKDPSDMLGK